MATPWAAAKPMHGNGSRRARVIVRRPGQMIAGAVTQQEIVRVPMTEAQADRATRQATAEGIVQAQERVTEAGNQAVEAATA